MKLLKKIQKEGGEVKDREKLNKWLNKVLDSMPDGEFLMEINPTDRTDSQNKFYWVCIGIIARAFGISPNTLHTHFKSEWLPTEEYLVLVKKRRKTSTSDMTKDEMTEYIDKVIRFAAEQGIVIPDPEEFKHSIY